MRRRLGESVWKQAASGPRAVRPVNADERRLNAPLSFASTAKAYECIHGAAFAAPFGTNRDKTMRVDWIFVDSATVDSVQVGDLVSAEAGVMPTYRVLALQDGRAWLRDEEHSADMISPLGRFRWKAAPSRL
jgi:hypothetical protein